MKKYYSQKGKQNVQSPAGRSWHGVGVYPFNGFIIILSLRDGFKNWRVGGTSTGVT
jgi:hypothetical protein